jgi:hypothetical protein
MVWAEDDFCFGRPSPLNQPSPGDGFRERTKGLGSTRQGGITIVLEIPLGEDVGNAAPAQELRGKARRSLHEVHPTHSGSEHGLHDIEPGECQVHGDYRQVPQ